MYKRQVLVIRKAMPIFRRVFRKYDALNDSVQENVQAIRVVKGYVREEYEKKKFSAAAGDVCKDFTRAERIVAINTPMMQFCVYVDVYKRQQKRIPKDAHTEIYILVNFQD